MPRIVPPHPKRLRPADDSADYHPEASSSSGNPPPTTGSARCARQAKQTAVWAGRRNPWKTDHAHALKQWRNAVHNGNEAEAQKAYDKAAYYARLASLYEADWSNSPRSGDLCD